MIHRPGRIATRLSTLVPIVIGLTAPLGWAQQYSPHPRFETLEGGSHCSFFGATPDQRYQMADGNFRNRPMVISRMAFRFRTMEYFTVFGAGRSFSRVTLDVAETDLATFSRNLAANLRTSPTRVFDRSVAWPTLQGQQTASGWPIAFPFTRPWSYSGQRDLLADYRFTGGQLTNGQTWSPQQTMLYSLDSYDVGDEARSPQTVHTRGSVCRDSAMGSTARPPRTDLVVTYFGPGYANAGLRNTFSPMMHASAMPPNRAVFHLFDVAGTATGIRTPLVACANLHVGGTALFGILPSWSYASGRTGPNFLGLPAPYGVPFHPGAVGRSLWAQTAWTDTRTGALKLTTAVAARIPAPPLYRQQEDARRRAAVQNSPSVSAVVNASNAFNPIVRYN